MPESATTEVMMRKRRKTTNEQIFYRPEDRQLLDRERAIGLN